MTRTTLGLTVALLVASSLAAAPTETFTFGAAGPVVVYAPAGPPEAVVLFLSGDGGWNLGVVSMAERLQGLGALVVGIDIRTFIRHLEASSARCAYPAGDLEELSRAIQLHRKLSSYMTPILVGYSSGATLVYAALAAAPPETFAGAISLGFCSDLEITKPLCRGRALAATPRPRGPGVDLAPDPTLGVPWHVLQGGIDQVCDPASTRSYAARVPSARLVWLPKVGHGFSVTRNWDPAFVAAYRSLAAASARARPSPPPALPDLPLVEVPGASGPPHEVMAVMLSGDGGWAGLDAGVASALSQRGIPVVGWSSLRYFWSPRTPDGAARDLERLIRHYLAAWGASRVLLLGYSFGADVLPYLAARLPPDLRARVAGVGLVGLEPEADFEFHVGDWLGRGGDRRYPTAPEVRRLEGLPVACVEGADESHSACRDLPPWATVLTVPGGHHFGGDYARLGNDLLAAFARPSPAGADRP
jgi:type IV secretory pathway VirJ component